MPIPSAMITVATPANPTQVHPARAGNSPAHSRLSSTSELSAQWLASLAHVQTLLFRINVVIFLLLILFYPKPGWMSRPDLSRKILTERAC